NDCYRRNPVAPTRVGEGPVSTPSRPPARVPSVRFYHTPLVPGSEGGPRPNCDIGCAFSVRSLPDPTADLWTLSVLAKESDRPCTLLTLQSCKLMHCKRLTRLAGRCCCVSHSRHAIYGMAASVAGARKMRFIQTPLLLERSGRQARKGT